MAELPFETNGRKVSVIVFPHDTIRVGQAGCVDIEVVSQCGPMGYYRAAKATYEDGSESLWPLHMVGVGLPRPTTEEGEEA